MPNAAWGLIFVATGLALSAGLGVYGALGRSRRRWLWLLAYVPLALLLFLLALAVNAILLALLMMSVFPMLGLPQHDARMNYYIDIYGVYLGGSALGVAIVYLALGRRRQQDKD